MRSATSCFDFTLYRKTLSRFWPLMAANLVVWVLYLPVQALMRLQEDSIHNTVNRLESFARNLGDNGGELGLVMAVALGLFAAMAVLSHLYSARSANFMGALPTRREGQFVSFYLAGLTMLLLPNVAVFFLTLLVEVMGGAVWLFPLGYWLAITCSAELFFYSFAVFLGQFTGHLLALPVFYGVFNFFVMAVYGLAELVMDNFYYGFTSLPDAVEEAAFLCTPIICFANMDCDVVAENGVWQQTAEGWQGMVFYAVLGLVFAACALLLYRSREMESAGDVVAVRVMRPVFAYGVAVCSGFAFGLLVTALLGLGEAGMMIAIVIWGVVGYFVANMLLEKSFRVLSRWKGAVAVSVAFLLLFAVIAFDLTGFETRIPDADDVASVDIHGLSSTVYDDGNYLNLTLTDPDAVQKVIDLHTAAVNQKDHAVNDPDSLWFPIEVQYNLKNGGSFAREYYVADRASNTQVPGTVSFAVEQIVSDRDIMYAAYGFTRMEALEREGGWLDEATFSTVEEYSEKQAGVFTAEEAARLLSAVKADFAAGNIGRRTAVRDEKDREGILYFTWAAPHRMNSSDVVLMNPNSWGYDYAAPETLRDEASLYYYNISILVDEDSVNTLALLEELLGE